MASYVVVGRSSEGSPLVSVSIPSIDQEVQSMDEMTVVNAVRQAVGTGTGVASVIVRKYEQTITVV
jgi:hypothetical protein